MRQAIAISSSGRCPVVPDLHSFMVAEQPQWQHVYLRHTSIQDRKKGNSRAVGQPRLTSHWPELRHIAISSCREIRKTHSASVASGQAGRRRLGCGVSQSAMDRIYIHHFPVLLLFCSFMNSEISWPLLINLALFFFSFLNLWRSLPNFLSHEIAEQNWKSLYPKLILSNAIYFNRSLNLVYI